MKKNYCFMFLVFAIIALCFSGVESSPRRNTAAQEPFATVDVSTNVLTLGHQYIKVPIANVSVAGVSGTVLTDVKVSTSATLNCIIQIIGGVDSLPTTGYSSGAICKLSSDGGVYVSTETVAGTQSWKKLW